MKREIRKGGHFTAPTNQFQSASASQKAMILPEIGQITVFSFF